MKKKKEIGIPKTQYIFQRYNGIITKYIINEEYYIDVKTGIAMKKNETILLGNISENIIDLIEVGDIVHYRINNISTTLETKGYIDVITIVEDENHLVRLKKDYNIEILEILTKEQYMQNCYKVKKEDI